MSQENHTLENRIWIDENIEAYEEILEKLYAEREKIYRRCYHEIRIIGLEKKIRKNKVYRFYEIKKDYCLICGNELSPTRVVTAAEAAIKPSVVSMKDYPNLRKKWGKNYRREVEKVLLDINRSFPSCSPKEICLFLKAKLGELNEGSE